MKKEFAVEFLFPILNGFGKGFVEEVDEGYHSRWVSHHFLIFEHEGKIWSAPFVRGLTEIQDVAQFETNPVECVEVEKKEVITYTWVPVKD